MILQHFLDDATSKLRDSGIETARLDVLVLLEDVLGLPRASLLARPEVSIPLPQLRKLNNYIVQRSTHTPLAYIRGRVEFFGRNFSVNTHVLVPRPETEAMIEQLKTLPLSAPPHIADIGTGSGCLGITAALEVPDASVTLIDIDAQALAVASRNALALGANVRLAQQDLLARDECRYDALLANLPYVPDEYTINQAARHEPGIALFGGHDGLEVYRRLWRQLSTHQPVYVLTESLLQQHKELAGLALEAGYHLKETDGLVQVFTAREQPQA